MDHKEPTNLNNNDSKLEDLFGKILYKFPVFHHNWEMDGYGFITETSDGKRHVILTNHSIPYKATNEELQNKIAEYTKLIADTKKAVVLFKGI